MTSRSLVAAVVVVVVVVVVALGAGCAPLMRTGAVDVATPVPKGASGAWEQVVREHTRKVEVYEWAVRRIDLRATLVTPRLRTAFIAAERRLHGRAADLVEKDLLQLGAPPDEGVDAEMQSRPDAEEQIILYVCFYVDDQKQRDLASSYTIWDTELVRGDARVKPLSIQPLPYSPALEALLPHADRFDEIYVVRFPIVEANSGTAMLSPGGPPLKLEVKSAIGYAIVEWDLTAR